MKTRLKEQTEHEFRWLKPAYSLSDSGTGRVCPQHAGLKTGAYGGALRTDAPYPQRLTGYEPGPLFSL